MPSAAQSPRNDSRFWLINAIVSAVALAILAYLLLIRRGSHDGASSSLAFMPAVNAGFNATSAVLLTLGVLAIRKKRVRQHQMLVIGAFASSLLFLAGYLAYHYAHAETKYPGSGLARTLYLLLLASHVILSVPVVPLCLAAFYYALTRRFETHKRITKILYPIWLYVSVTGVVVFFLLRSAY
jgi:putative membrane protein